MANLAEMYRDQDRIKETTAASKRDPEESDVARLSLYRKGRTCFGMYMSGWKADAKKHYSYSYKEQLSRNRC